jgi:hypothetical protein
VHWDRPHLLSERAKKLFGQPNQSMHGFMLVELFAIRRNNRTVRARKRIPSATRFSMIT